MCLFTLYSHRNRFLSSQFSVIPTSFTIQLLSSFTPFHFSSKLVNKRRNTKVKAPTAPVTILFLVAPFSSLMKQKDEELPYHWHHPSIPLSRIWSCNTIDNGPITSCIETRPWSDLCNVTCPNQQRGPLQTTPHTEKLTYPLSPFSQPLAHIYCWFL